MARHHMTPDGPVPFTPEEEAERDAEEAAWEAGKRDRAAADVRKERDDKLADCDWLVIKAYETNSHVPASWGLYRQQLREVSQQPGFPFDIQWPTPPS